MAVTNSLGICFRSQLFIIMQCFLVLKCLSFNLKAVPGPTVGRRRRAWPSDDEDEQLEGQPESSPIRENSVDEEVREG